MRLVCGIRSVNTRKTLIFVEIFQRAGFKNVSSSILQATPTAYLTGIPGASTQVGNTYTPYFSPAGPLIGPTTIITSDPNNPLAMAVQQTMVTQQKMPRNDRLDVSKKKICNPCFYCFSPVKKEKKNNSAIDQILINFFFYQDAIFVTNTCPIIVISLDDDDNTRFTHSYHIFTKGFIYLFFFVNLWVPIISFSMLLIRT